MLQMESIHAAACQFLDYLYGTMDERDQKQNKINIVTKHKPVMNTSYMDQHLA
jgi:hypothetical protein